MQTTITNPTPNQYFRKVKTDGTFKKTFKVLGLYFTVSNCRVKKRHACGYSRQGHEGKLIWQAKQRLYKEHNGRCPHCGRKFDFDVMELHHVLPYARFQDLITDERNLLLLCHDCHKEIHCNPFLNIRLMQAKADELGIDLHDRYDRWQTSLSLSRAKTSVTSTGCCGTLGEIVATRSPTCKSNLNSDTPN